MPVVRGTDEEEGVHRGRFAAVAVRRVPSERHRRARGHGAGGRVPRVRRVGHGCLWSDIGGRWGVVTFCWTPVSLFFDYAMSPSSRLRLAMLVPKVSLILSSRYQVMYPSSRSMNPLMVTPAKSRPRRGDKGLRTFSWSCFLYGQPLACSVFYRAFPAQRLFDPRMVVPADVLAGEAAGLLARTLLPMPGDARTRVFMRPKNPSAAALSGLHPFALMDRTRPCRPIRSSHPGHR